MLFDWELARWYQLLLVFMRTLALFTIAPIFGSRNTPIAAKVGLAALIALLVGSAMGAANLSILTLAHLLLDVAKEMLVGLIIGFIGLLMFTSIQVAGQLIDTHMEFGMVNIMDPQTQTQAPLMGTFYHILALLLFLTLNGHHIFIYALAESYYYVPLGGVVGTQWSTSILQLFSSLFVVAIKISAPIITALLLTDLALGILSRTVHQLHVFFLGAPLKILLGMTLLVASLPVYYGFFRGMFSRLAPDIIFLLQQMGAN